MRQQRRDQPITFTGEHDTPEDDALWQAVLAHDAGRDGQFVYAVRTTGVFCRPSCPARRPSRKHVRFFARAEEALDAGFRPCRRCQPQDSLSPEGVMIQQVCDYIADHPDAPVTLSALGALTGYSPFHLQRVFKRNVGITPRQYAEARRLECFKAQIKQGDAVTRASYDVGYGSSSQLYAQFPARSGMTPATYRKGGAGMRISFAIAGSSLGYVLMAATERGVCAVTLGESPVEMERMLFAEFPAATIERDDALIEPWLGAVSRYLDGQPSRLDLPLDVRATAFQSRVWAALRAIPYGSMRTYRQVARALGEPAAARAVAQACAANPVAIVIPCHRVVREGGDLAGYRWGLARKRTLLQMEARGAPDDAPLVE